MHDPVQRKIVIPTKGTRHEGERLRFMSVVRVVGGGTFIRAIPDEAERSILIPEKHASVLAEIPGLDELS